MRTPGRAALCAGFLVASFAVVGPHGANAHTPHDVVADVEVSPRFADDQRVYAIVREHLLRSDDGGHTWTRLVRGLDNASQLRAVEVSAQDPEVLFVGTLQDGIYRSGDGGLTWTDANGDLPSLAVRSLALSPRSSDVVLATIVREQVPILFRSGDGGAHWAAVPAAGAPTVLAFASGDPDTVLAGSASGEVRTSRDGGVSWTSTFSADDVGGVTALAAAPGAPVNELLVATRDAGIFAGRLDGDLRPVEAPDDAVTSIALSPSFRTDGRAWASTWQSGAMRSDDGGRSWTPQSEGVTTNEQADSLGRAHFGPVRIAAIASPGDPTLFLAGFDGLFHSTGGGPWGELTTQPSTIVASIAVSPTFTEDQTIAVATYLNGAWISHDAGMSWTAANDGLAYEGVWSRAEDYFARLVNIGFSPSFRSDRTMFAGERGYLLRRDADGHPWDAQIPDGLLVEGELPPDYALWAFSPSYGEDHTIVLGSSRGKSFLSSDGGLTFERGADIGAPVLSLGWVPSGEPGGTILAGTATGVRRTDDGGRTWEPMGLDTHRVTSLAVPADFATTGRVVAGTPLGLFVRTDAAPRWALVDGLGVAAGKPVEAVATSPAFARDGTMLVSVAGHGLFRSSDRGETFTPIAPDLLASSVVLGGWYHRTTEPIVFSPGFERDRTVFATAGSSIYRSTDAGTTWRLLELPVSTHDLDPDATPATLLRIIDPADAHGIAPNEERGSADAIAPAVGGTAAVIIIGVTAILWRRRRSPGHGP